MNQGDETGSEPSPEQEQLLPGPSGRGRIRFHGAVGRCCPRRPRPKPGAGEGEVIPCAHRGRKASSTKAYHGGLRGTDLAQGKHGAIALEHGERGIQEPLLQIRNRLLCRGRRGIDGCMNGLELGPARAQHEVSHQHSCIHHHRHHHAIVEEGPPTFCS